MTTNKYVPDEEQVREAWRAFTGPNRDHGFDAFLARVRRDAKAEALREAADGLNPYPTIGYTIPQELRDRAAEYETGDSDEHR